MFQNIKGVIWFTLRPETGGVLYEADSIWQAVDGKWYAADGIWQAADGI